MFEETRECITCGEVKGIRKFKLTGTRGHRRRTCFACTNAEREQLVNSHKLSTGCQSSDCGWTGEFTTAMLHADHIDPTTKIQDVSTMVKSQKSIKLIKEELNKCRILCANCHYRRHANALTQI